MPILNLTNEELHARLFHVSSLNESQRKAIYDLIQHLNSAHDWYPERFHKELKALHDSGVLSDLERQSVEKAFS